MKDTVLYRLLRPFFVFYMKCRFSPKITGYENLPKTGAYIIVANHTNNHDFISMGMITKRQVHFLAKDSLFRGVLGPIMKGVGAVSVNRRIKDKSVIPTGCALLRKNLVLGVFPEGTFNTTSSLLASFKIGAVKMASECHVAIIPVAILGRYKRGKLNIVIEKPFWVSSPDLEKENQKLRNILKRVIVNNRGEM